MLRNCSTQNFAQTITSFVHLQPSGLTMKFTPLIATSILAYCAAIEGAPIYRFGNFFPHLDQLFKPVHNAVDQAVGTVSDPTGLLSGVTSGLGGVAGGVEKSVDGLVGGALNTVDGLLDGVVKTVGGAGAGNLPDVGGLVEGASLPAPVLSVGDMIEPVAKDTVEIVQSIASDRIPNTVTSVVKEVGLDNNIIPGASADPLLPSTHKLSLPLAAALPSVGKRAEYLGLHDVATTIVPQLEKSVDRADIPEDVRSMLHKLLDFASEQLLDPEKRDIPRLAKELATPWLPQLNSVLDREDVPEDVRRMLRGFLDLASQHLNRRGKLEKPADVDDPNFARVVLDDKVNEMYRLAMVDRFKIANPSMQLRQEDFDFITEELSLLAISVDEEEYCEKVEHLVQGFELTYKTEDFKKMCGQQRDELMAAFEEEERYILDKEAALDITNTKGIEGIFHHVAEQRKKDAEHLKHAMLEKSRWVDKQEQRAKHEDAVKNGEKGDIYKRSKRIV